MSETSPASTRAREEEQPRGQEERLRLFEKIFLTSQDGIAITDCQGNYLEQNPAHKRLLGYSDEELRGMTPEIHLGPEVFTAIKERLSCGQEFTGEVISRSRSGEECHVDLSAFAVRNAEGEIECLVGIKRDITKRKLAEEDRRRLEEQLRQAQKMEAVGRLAGGVAHDFNNILTAILGHADLSQATVGKLLPDEARLHSSLHQIEQAARRAADLTRQLLVFSRRDVSQPRHLDLNQVLDSIEMMVRRLVTESISVERVCASELKHVHADPGQLEQVVMNLVVNARDAMPDGGKLALTTANVVLGEAECGAHPDARPGPYVQLSVSDTGCGMDEATIARVFEPFFTTKEVGVGTGLGLSVVFGIVRGSGGHVIARGEPGRGSTFDVYLPAVELPASSARRKEREDPARGGRETVLVCEDDPAVRSLTVRILAGAGYRVLTACNGDDALETVVGHDAPIDLLVTDVIMPGMNGKELADRLASARPDLRTVFMSGYSADVIAPHGVLNAGVEFLEKPFNSRHLLERVRGVLDGAPGARRG